MMVTNEQLCISATIAQFTSWSCWAPMCRAVGTSNPHPEQLVLEGDDVAGTKLDLGDLKTVAAK